LSEEIYASHQQVIHALMAYTSAQRGAVTARGEEGARRRVVRVGRKRYYARRSRQVASGENSRAARAALRYGRQRHERGAIRVATGVIRFILRLRRVRKNSKIARGENAVITLAITVSAYRQYTAHENIR